MEEYPAWLRRGDLEECVHLTEGRKWKNIPLGFEEEI